MRSSNPLLDACKHLGLLGIAMAALTLPGIGAAQNKTYDWSAELVGVDKSANAVTVKSYVVVPEAHEAVTKFKAGDDVTIVWSGINFAAGVSAVADDVDAEGRLTLPAEFVGTELDGRYVIFKVRVPEAGVQAVGNLNAGAWVTATSPMGASDAAEAVISMRPYVNAAG